MRSMIVGTAGHVDHGKTTLVRALTGVDTDRLAEEKRRGISIELGYAYDGALGFVDVPGHERLVHTMLAGAGGIDAALIVVAADDGVMPQTREHAAILDLLGITRAVVAVTKLDRAPGRFDAVADEMRALLADTSVRDADILAVRALAGEGVDALRAALLALGPAPRDRDGYARLAIDRAFVLRGAGLVVTGTLVAGRVAVDDRLTLSPQGLEVRVRGLHAQNRPAAEAHAGQRVALNIAGAKVSKEIVARGDWVVHPDIDAPAAAIDARIRLLPGCRVRDDTRVHLHIGAADMLARFSPLGAAGHVRLTLDRPNGAWWGDRIVLRDAAATRTLGGGMVLDPCPPRRARASPARLQRLAAMDDVSALPALLRIAPHWTSWPEFWRARALPPDRRARLLAAAGGVLLADAVAAGDTERGWRGAVTRALGEHHAAAPEEAGLPAERLRMQLDGRPPPAALRALLGAMLRASEIGQDGPFLRLPAHRPSLSPLDERVWSHAGALIAAEAFRPPRTRDLAGALSVPEAAMRASLKRFARLGRLVEVAPDHFFLREAVAEMARVAVELARADEGGTLTAAAFRDRLGNGRKVAIQVLEFFDRTGFTVRRDDERYIRPDKTLLFRGLSDT